MTPPKVVVVGGGITGLAAAWRLEPLARAGRLEVELWEASERLGGAIRSYAVAGAVVEGGPDSLLRRKPEAERLAEAVGLGGELIPIHPQHRGSYLYHAGRLHPIPEGLEAGIPTRLGPLWRSPLLSLWGKLRAVGDLVRPPVPVGDDMALGELLRRRFGREVVTRLAEPLLSGVYAGDLNTLSTAATFPQFLEWARKPGSLLAGAAAARRARPRPSAAQSPFLTLAGGLEGLVRAVAARLSGIPVVLSRPVVAVEPAPAGWRVRSEGGETVAQAVIVAAPAWAAAAILHGLGAWSGLLAEIPYTNLAVVGMIWPHDAVPRPLDRTGFLVPRDEGLRITACTFVHAKWAYPEPPPHAVLRVFLGRAGTDILREDDAALLAIARADLERVLGRFRGDPVWTGVFRLPRALPQYTVGHRQRLDQLRAALTRHPGLYLAGAGYDGVGIPDCIRQGQAAADAVLAHLGLPRPGP